MELLLISALHPQVPCPEPERDEDGSSSECDSGAPSIAPESSQPGTSSQADSRPSQVSKLPNHKRQQTTAIDDALLKLVEQASATQRLCQQVDEVLSSNRNPSSMFSQWIGAETEMLPDHMFRQFQTEVFATVMTYRDTAAQQPQVTPILPTMPPVMLQHSGELPSAASPCLSSIALQSMAWQPPTHMSTQLATHDRQPAPAYQQQDQAPSPPQQHTGLSSLSSSGLSGLQFSPVPSDDTAVVTVTTTQSDISNTGVQLVQSNQNYRYKRCMCSEKEAR